tara:strand:+ start:333 stop:686 length:354 start_codon:yes stop_codon:yes gene_type:complete
MGTKYDKRLANSPELQGALQWILAEAFELGYIPSITNTESKKLCLVLSNKDSGKVALLGTMYDDDGTPEIVACDVMVKNWLWAENEGFTTDEIVDNDKLYSKVFKRVPPEALPWILA